MFLFIECNQFPSINGPFCPALRLRGFPAAAYREVAFLSRFVCGNQKPLWGLDPNKKCSFMKQEAHSAFLQLWMGTNQKIIFLIDSKTYFMGQARKQIFKNFINDGQMRLFFKGLLTHDRPIDNSWGPRFCKTKHNNQKIQNTC